MTEDDLKRLKHLPVPAPRDGAKEAAVAAALAAFEPAASGRGQTPRHQPSKENASDESSGLTPFPPQGSELLPRLRNTSISEGSSSMRYRRPAASAASIVVLAVAVPLTLYLVQTPRVADHGGPQGHSRGQEQPRDKVAALSKPAPAESPAPPAKAAPEQPPAPPTTRAPAPPTAVQIGTRPNRVDQRRLPDEDAKSLVFDDTLLFDIDKFAGYDRY